MPEMMTTIAPVATHAFFLDGRWREDGDVVEYMKVRDMPGLIGLAQLGTLETHVWGCHADNVERPDFMVFDLDPDVGLAWDRVALAAFDVRKRLREIGLESWIKTTGGKGLHVCVPLARKLDWDRFKAWSKAFADKLAARLRQDAELTDVWANQDSTPQTYLFLNIDRDALSRLPGATRNRRRARYA